ncbi:MAG: type II toxin-antitoxin system MqsA family antitoxin [Thermodesulfobacteriota bacterium]
MLKKDSVCPICGHGKISEKVIVEIFRYQKKKISVPDYHVLECDTCGEKIVSNETLKRTEKILTDFRRKVDGFLTSDEIKRIREKLDKTQTEMAIFLDVGEKNFARYENGQVTQSKAMDTLLRILDTDPNILSKVGAKKEIQTDYKELFCIVSETKQDKDVEYSQKTPKDYESNTGIAYAA